jgi:hypothetical protein
MKIRFVRDYKLGAIAYKKGKVIDLSPHEVETLRLLAPDVFQPVEAGEVHKHLPRPTLDRMIHAPKVTK